jgi:hypothetical protein
MFIAFGNVVLFKLCLLDVLLVPAGGPSFLVSARKEAKKPTQGRRWVHALQLSAFLALSPRVQSRPPLRTPSGPLRVSYDLIIQIAGGGFLSF